MPEMPAPTTSTFTCWAGVAPGSAAWSRSIPVSSTDVTSEVLRGQKSWRVLYVGLCHGRYMGHQGGSSAAVPPESPEQGRYPALGRDLRGGLDGLPLARQDRRAGQPAVPGRDDVRRPGQPGPR